MFGVDIREVDILGSPPDRFVFGGDSVSDGADGLITPSG